MRKFLLLLHVAMIAAIAAGGVLPVDENAFFASPVNFSPEEERHLDEQWLKKPAEIFPFAHGEVKTLNGIPWPFIDGREVKSFSRAIMRNQVGGLPVSRMMRGHGVNVFVLDVEGFQNKPAPAAGFTLAQTSFGNFERSMETLLETVPDAKVIVRFWLTNVPEDYLEQYPEAVLTGSDGKTDWGRTYYSTHTQRPNFLNEWRRYNGEFLHKFIRLTGKSRFAPHVAGFYLAAMNTAEWWYYKGAGDVGWDYSPGRKAAFKYYLNEKYGPNHVEILKKLWNADSAEEVYRLPTLKERSRYPVAPCSKIADYNQVLNQPVTNAAIYFAQVIKSQTAGRCLAGMEIHAHLNIFKSNGTVFLNHLLDAPEIDFLGGPPDYTPRSAGNYSAEQAALASLQRHGKFWFSEEDIRTHNAYGTVSGAQGQPPLSRETSISVIRRQFAAAVCRGYLGYLMDFGWRWFHDREIIKSVQDCNTIFEYLTKAGKLRRRAEIALVSDQESQLYGNYYANATLNRAYTLSHSGLDADFFELRDFLRPGAADPYKMVVFMNIRALSDAERAGIEKLKEQNRTLIFLHDPGFVNLNRTDGDAAAGASKLVGIELSGEGRPVNGKIIYDPAVLQRHLQMENALQDENINAARTVTGRQVSYSDAAEGLYVGNVLSGLHSVDSGASSLGKDGSGNAVLAMKKFPDWTSVYSAACLMPPPLLRALARYSGIALPTDQADVVFSAGDVLAIHAISDGRRNIVMPRQDDVVELFSRNVVARNARAFSHDFKFGETRIFVSGDADAVIGELKALDQRNIAEIAAFEAKFPAPRLGFGFFSWQRFQRPESYFKPREQPFENRYGDFPMNGVSPSVYLVADATVDAVPVRALHEGDIPDLYSDASRLNTLRSGGPPMQWEALAGAHPFVYAQELGIGEGRRGKIAFYLRHPVDKRVRILFTATDNAKCFLNGAGIVIPETGEAVTLSGELSLFVIELENPDGNAGFSIKFYEPGANVPHGDQLSLRDAAKDLKVRLAPLGYNKQLAPVTEEIETPGLANLEFAKSGRALCETRFAIDSAALYTMAATFRGGDDAAGNLLLAFQVFDKNNRAIGSRNVHFVSNTETRLARPVDAADSVVYLQNAESWHVKPPNGAAGYIAFAVDTPGNYADLPNFNLTPAITKIEKTADGWAVTLAGAAGRTHPAGTAVREHRDSSTYNSVQTATRLNQSGRTSGTLQGISAGNPEKGKWWPGARYARPLVSVNLKSGTLTVENVKISKETLAERDAG